MSPNFTRTFKRVAIVHVALVGLFLLASLISMTIPRKRRQTAIPVDFLVAMPAPERPLQQAVAPPQETTAPAKTPTKRPPIKPSTERAVRTTGDPKPTLTREQIQRLLDKGAKPADRTVIPAEEQRYFAIIRRVLYGAWQPPSPAEAGDSVAEVSLRLLPGGVIGGWKIAKPSGNALLDASVETALGSVRKIPNLSAAFLNSHREVTISFQVVQ